MNYWASALEGVYEIAPKLGDCEKPPFPISGPDPPARVTGDPGQLPGFLRPLPRTHLPNCFSPFSAGTSGKVVPDGEWRRVHCGLATSFRSQQQVLSTCCVPGPGKGQDCAVIEAQRRT